MKCVVLGSETIYYFFIRQLPDKFYYLLFKKWIIIFFQYKECLF